MAPDERSGGQDGDDRSAEVPVEELDEMEDDPEAPLYSTVPLETDHGTVVIQQQVVGREREVGGGEWPDPDTPPRLPAPGAAVPEGDREEVDDGDE